MNLLSSHLTLFLIVTFLSKARGFQQHLLLQDSLTCRPSSQLYDTPFIEQDVIVELSCERESASFLEDRHRNNASARGLYALPTFRIIAAGLSYVGLCFVLSLILVAWEDLSYDAALPSRQMRSLVVKHPYTQQSYEGMVWKPQWGQVTVRGMGFGSADRRALIADGDGTPLQLPWRESYNEIMLHHRQVRLPSWKVSSLPVDSAVHAVLASLESMPQLQTMAADYQWNELRSSLQSSMWQDDLSLAADRLRQINDDTSSVVGFDWGSCAWRHCGAWSDWEESIDQIDALLGLLEPKEVLFCLDIVERSLRDVLAVVPRDQWLESDWKLYQNLPAYQTYDYSNPDASDGNDDFDDPYLQALWDLSLD